MIAATNGFPEMSTCDGLLSVVKIVQEDFSNKMILCGKITFLKFHFGGAPRRFALVLTDEEEEGEGTKGRIDTIDFGQCGALCSRISCCWRAQRFRSLL